MNKRLLCLTIFLCCILALCSCNDPGQPPEKVNADESVSGSASESGINKNEDLTSEISVPSSVEAESSEPLTYIIKEPKPVDDVSLPDVMYETVNGKKIEFKFDKVVPREGVQIHDRRSYISAQGDRADYDVKTGDLTCLFIENVADLDETQVSEEQAREIADAFIKKYCDLSEYELMRCKYNSVTGTDVTYAKYICGVRTSDWVGVNVWMDGTISSFFRNPHIFDNMDIKSIDIASMRSEVGKQMKEKYKDRLADYSIVDECLILDDSGRPQVKILVEPQMKDSDGSGALDDYYFPLQ